MLQTSTLIKNTYFYRGTSYRLGRGQHPLIDKNQKKNLTELNILESSRTFYGILEQSRTV